MIRPHPISGIRKRLAAITGQSERTIMLGTILLASSLSAFTAYVLAHYYAVDVLSSLTFFPEDCWGNWGTNIGRHCFSDYAMVVGAGTRPDPFEPYQLFPPSPPIRVAFPAGMLPALLFGLPAQWLGAPLLGVIGYQLALAIAVLSPAVWAARGARGLERVVVFVALGTMAIPAWALLDRGNSAGFVVPIALVFLVGLHRRRWGVVALTVVLAAIVNPQFAVFAVALFAVRQWRLGLLTVAGVAVSNLAAYLLWPQHFPATLTEAYHNLFSTAGTFSMLVDMRNVSFARALLLFPDYFELAQTGGKIPDGFLAGPRSWIGYAVLAVAVVALLVLGRRIPPVLIGIVLLANATFFPPLALFYHLIFVLPVAALVARNPDGPPGAGVFDQLALQDGRRRAVGIWVSLAVALTIAQIALPPAVQATVPGVEGTRWMVGTTVWMSPFLWLVACTLIIVSYGRRPTAQDRDDLDAARDDSPATA